MSERRFEEMLRVASETGADKPWRDAIAQVMDTAWFAYLWLEDRAIPYTAADVVALTSLVVRREEALRQPESDAA